MAAVIDFAQFHQLLNDCMQIYEAAHGAHNLAAETNTILKQVDQLMEAAGIAYLKGRRQSSMPRSSEEIAAEAQPVAASYRDTQLRFSDLKIATYDLGKTLLDDEHACDRGLILITALAQIAPGFRDVKTLKAFGDHFCPACEALAQEDWEAAQTGFTQSLRILTGHKRALALQERSFAQPIQAATQDKKWQAVYDLACRWQKSAPDNASARAMKRVSWLNLAQVEMMAEQWPDAQTRLATWLKTHADDVEAHALYRDSYLRPAQEAIRRGQWSISRQWAETWLKISPNDTDAISLHRASYLLPAQQALEAEQWDLALQEAEAWLNIMKQDDEALAIRRASFIRETEAALQSHQWAAATGYLEAWLAVDSEAGEATRMLCEILYSEAIDLLAQDQRSHAMKILDRLLKVNANYGGGHDALLSRHGDLLWFVDPPRKLQTLSLFDEHGCPSWSPDGQWLVSPDRDRVVVWDTEGNKEIRVLQQSHTSAFRSIFWSADGQRLAIAGTGVVIIWNALTDELSLTVPGRVALSPDGLRFASSNPYSSSEVKIWDSTSGKVVRTILDPNRELMTWSPDSRLLALRSNSAHTTVAVWDVGTEQQVHEIDPTVAGPVAWSPDGQLLACAGSSGITQWRTEDWTLVSRHVGFNGAQKIAWSPDGRCLIACIHGRTTAIDPGRGTRLYECQGDSAEFSPDGQLLVTWASEMPRDWAGRHRVWLHDPIAWISLYPLPLGNRHWVRNVAWRPDSKRLGILHLSSERSSSRYDNPEFSIWGHSP